MWRVAAIQGHFDPWHPRIIDKCEAQLDAILQAYSEDRPKELRFERKGKSRNRRDIEESSTLWANKLIGAARDSFKSQVSFKIPEGYRAGRPRTQVVRTKPKG